jgi:IPT/TIG domain/Regulator of chromosome condensation (RCC1) repeat
VRQVAAGANHSLALLNNGTVVAWGDNEDGQLGTGSAALQSEVPTPVKGLTGVTAIAAGGNESLALLSNGSMMAWGAGEAGQLGNGTVKSSGVPVAVKGLSGVTAISAGGDFALALLSSGTVEAWGSDEYDQLGAGAGEAELSDVPIAVSGVSGASAIAAGANHGLALLGDGTVRAWGEDALGELGDGVLKAREATPVVVSGLSGVSSISAGGGSSAALLASGAVMTWGNDHSGQLGNGTSGTVSDVPVQVSGLAKAAAVSVGTSHMLAFGEPRPAVTAVSPSTGPVAGATTVTISGANLGGATAVRFGSSEAAFTVESATSISATAPPGTLGAVNVTVVTPAGTSPTVAADRYTYQQPPTITKVTPATGPVGGGTSITITGTEFTAASAVMIGAAPATTYKVLSATTITATVPPASAGTVDVRVTNSAGTSAVVSKDHYRYAPTVDALEPNGGPVTGGTVVTVTGTGFAPGTTGTVLKFGKVKGTGVSCASSTTCTVTAPAQTAAGPVDVVATVNRSSSAKKPADVFTYG